MRTLFFVSTIAVVGLTHFAIGHSPQSEKPAESVSIDWRETEQGNLVNHQQLTFPEQFVKAGEAYFSPDNSRIIFQAIETPPEGDAADEFYAMFVADVVRDAVSGHITGIENIKRLSPDGSANTCGWWHPTDLNVVIFASTIGPPSDSEAPGYQRGSKSRYRWMFPKEMRIVRCDLREADGSTESLELIAGDDEAYQAEGSLSTDGRHLLYCSLESGEGDLFVKDMNSLKTTRLFEKRGYDGGPFFSPDGTRICYRSDRKGDHYLQLFVADLKSNTNGEFVGIEREYQVTDDGAVNWAPFWHPSGRFVIYATSTVGHHNYEVFLIDADSGNLPGSTGSIKYGTRKQRVTHAGGADVLPVFSTDGKTMMWTSQRGEDRSSQLWAADFVMKLDGDQ